MSDEGPKSYGEAVGDKALRAVVNIFSSPLEIPKNVINATNATINPGYYDSNVFFGMTGGTAKGFIVFLGRLGVGLADLITIPLPTKEIAHPNFIWEDFDIDTTFGPVFRLEDYTVASNPNTEPYVYEPADDAAARAKAQDDAARAAAAAAEEADRQASESAQKTDEKLDKMFEQSMKK
ncbi:MAG: alanine-zipper protein [Gammaproteobacteria bacterium]